MSSRDDIKVNSFYRRTIFEIHWCDRPKPPAELRVGFIHHQIPWKEWANVRLDRIYAAAWIAHRSPRWKLTNRLCFFRHRIGRCTCRLYKTTWLKKCAKSKIQNKEPWSPSLPIYNSVRNQYWHQYAILKFSTGLFQCKHWSKTVKLIVTTGNVLNK